MSIKASGSQAEPSEEADFKSGLGMVGWKLGLVSREGLLGTGLSFITGTV